MGEDVYVMDINHKMKTQINDQVAISQSTLTIPAYNDPQASARDDSTKCP